MGGAAEQRLQRIAATLEDDALKTGQLFAQLENLELELRRVPIGGVAQLYLSGLALASATNSSIYFAGNSDLTTNVFGEVANSQTPTKSLSGS